MAHTLNHMFQESVRTFADTPALGWKIARAYQTMSYREMGVKVRTLVSGLVTTGLKKGDRVALLSENRPEWALIDIGLMHIGSINVAIFPKLPAGQVEYILADSGSTFIFISDREQLAKALEIKKVLPHLRIIAMDCASDASNDVMALSEAMARGESSPLGDRDYDEIWQSIQADDWASIIYTSGTTGMPKGVILSHRNFTSNIEAAKEVLTFQPGEVLLSLVPLNHSLGRLVDHYLTLSCGSTIFYVDNPLRLRQHLTEVKPHYMVVVPRVLEMLQESVKGNITKEAPRKQKMFVWGLSAGKKCCERIQKNQRLPLPLAFQWWLADKLVFRKIRARLGLQRLKLFFSGGAPLLASTAEFFSTMRLPIMEGYGLTETSPLVTVNPPDGLKVGSVGLPLKGVEVKIAEDGEILVRGPNVMQGYYHKSDETADAIDTDGWFHTGDVGKFDEEGFLSIVDRKKNLLVLANGKKVAPQPIEASLMNSAYIAQVVLLGDQRPTVTALIVPDFGRLRYWAKEHKIPGDLENTRELVQHPDVHRLIQDEILRCTVNLADFEKVRRFSLLDHEFTVDNGELTPTFKVRRTAVVKKYRDLIEAMYRPAQGG